MQFIDPNVACKLIIGGGWLLAALGAIKMVIYAVGEFFPGAYSRIRSVGFRKVITGKGNRLIFGLGGILTLFLGLIFVVLGIFVRMLSERLIH